MAGCGGGAYTTGVFLPDPSGHRDVALGLCQSAGRVLVVLNARSAQGTSTKFWDLPGGTVEAGEALVEALQREWQEEVGFAASVGDLLLVVDGAKRTDSDAPPLYTWRAFIFEVHAPAFGAMSAPGPEIEKIDFVRIEDVPMRLTAPYQAPLVRYLMRGGLRHARTDWLEPAAAEPSSPLAADLRHLLILAAAAAVGETALVATEAAAARAAGVSLERLEEALLQIVPYAGFPRALAAFAAARPAFGPALPPAETTPEAPADARPALGAEAFGRVYGETAPRVAAGLAALHPLLPSWTQDFAYGRVLARPALDPCTRELMGVSILTALGRADDALLGHMRAALRLGASKDALAGAVSVVPASAGAGRRAQARALLARV